MELDGAEVLVIGAGGAARAVVFALRGRGAHVRVANRTPQRAAELGDPIPFVREVLDVAVTRAALVVNTTSLGLHGDEVPPGAAPGGHRAWGRWWPTSSTGPAARPWLAAAAARGARPVDGLGMLLHQGAAAFEQWTGVAPAGRGDAGGARGVAGARAHQAIAARGRS